MSDLEHDLREMFHRREGDAPAAPPDGARLIGRTRRRQGLVVGASALGVALIAVASFAGIRALQTTDGGTPADEPTTTTTINGISITHPEGWFVFDPDDLNGTTPGPANLARPGLPHLVLGVSPADPGELFGCPGLVEGTAPAFLMTLQERSLALAGTSSAPWPVPLEPMPIDSGGGNDFVAPPSGCFPEWEFLRAGWTSGGRTFEARVGFAPDVSADERTAMLAAFESLSFEPATSAATSVVIATGTAGGEDWELRADRQADGLSLMLEAESFGTGGGFDGPSAELFVLGHVFGDGEQAQVVVFGEVPEVVVRVEAFPALGSPAVAVDVIDVPASIDPQMNAFVIVADPDLPVELNAYGADGSVLLRGTFSGSNEPTGTPLPVQPPEVMPTHGGTVWGLYLAAGPALDDPTMDAAIRQAEALGYTPSSGDLACDDGAADALNVDDGSSGVAVYFATREDAEAATQFFDEWVGIARVTTYCLD
jgi:hypothetical protein